MVQMAEADELFTSQKFGQAFSIYADLLKTDPLNANLNYKIGACYLKSRSLKTKALPYLEKAIEFSPSLTHDAEQKNTDAPVIAYKLLGDAYCMIYKFDQAIAAYEKFKSISQQKKTGDAETLHTVNGKIETCKFGKELKELVALPVKITPDKPGKKIDTSFRHPVTTLSPDKSTITFTYKIPVNRIKKSDDANFFEEIIVKPDTIKKITASEPSSYTPTPDTVIYVTTIGASVDGQIVLSYKNERGDGNLYITRLVNNVWSQPLKVNKSTNPYGWEPNECISPDGNTLYFVSNRPGGYGGKDIYKCSRTGEGWSKAINMGPAINSAYDEEAPFIHPDGSTLFFSSNKNKPKEYFDNYMTSVTDSNVGKPVAVGYPVDKSADNSYYQVTADKKKISPTVTADRKKIKQLRADSLKDKTDKRDNFLITFIDQKNIPVTLLKGKININQEKNETAQITVTDNETGTITGLYHPDFKSGLFSFIIPSGKNNNITYSSAGYLFYSENRTLNGGKEYFERNNSINLLPLEKESKVILNNIFFEDGKGAPLKTSQTELNTIYQLLDTHSGLSIQLSNTIYSAGNKKFYKRLSLTRAKAIKEKLVAMGIQEERIVVTGCRKPKPKAKKQPVPVMELPYQQMELTISDIK